MKEARTKLTDSVSVPSIHEQHYKEKDTMLIFFMKAKRYLSLALKLRRDNVL